MNNGWRIWFALLIVAALYGVVMIDDAQTAAEVNGEQITGAPQQTVVGLWQLTDVATIVVYELIVAVVAIASIGLLLISRADPPPLESEQPPKREAHSDRPDADDEPAA